MNQNGCTPKPRSRNLAAMAHHEAAHIIVGLNTGRWWFKTANIVPQGRDGRASGWVETFCFAESAGFDKLAIISLAGPHAQRRFAPRSNWRHDADGDYKNARARIKKLGLTGRRAAAKFAELDALAKQAVADHWPDIVKVAEALLEKRTLTYDQVCHDVLGEPRLFREPSRRPKPLIYGPMPKKVLRRRRHHERAREV
jgi:hypothetical protein